MKLNSRTVIISVAAGLLLLYFTSQSGRFDIGSASVGSAKLKAGGLQINVRLPIINRSDFSVPATGFLGRLLYNGVEIGTLQQVAPVTLQPRAVSVLEFSTVISYLGVLTNTPLLSILNTLAKKYIGLSLPGVPTDAVLDAGTLGKVMQSMRVHGTLYLGQFSFNINEPLSA